MNERKERLKKLLPFLYKEDSYGTDRYIEYYEQQSDGWSYEKTEKNSKKIGVFAALGSIALMIFFHISWVFFWVPPLAYFVTAMLCETFGMKVLSAFSNNRYIKMQQQKEEENRIREQLKSIPPEKLNTEYALMLISRWEKIEVPSFMKNEFVAICKDLRDLVQVTKDNNINIDKWTQLFRNYMPDIVDVIDDFESDDGVNDTQMMELCGALHVYLVSEIEDVKNGKRISNSATVKAYTELFKGNVSGFKKQEDGTPMGGV